MSSTPYIQNFFTSRDNNANAETYVGQEGRLWWDPISNQIYSSNGNTPGGIPLAGGGSGNPGGSNGQVQFNNNGTFGGSGNLTFNQVTGQLSSASFSTTGNINGGNLFGTTLSASGNVGAGNFITTGLISSTGNITGNYLLGNGAFITGLPSGYSNANVAAYLPTYSGNLVSLTGPVTTTSNITGGNVLTGGLITAVGNITSSANISGNYILGNGYYLTGISGGSGSTNKIYNGLSYANIATASGNLVISANGAGWTFDTTGTLTLPYGAVLSDSATSTLTLGNGAGNIGNVQDGAIAIGWLTGTGGQGYDAVAIGSSAASDGFQGESAVAIGGSAGGDTQGVYAVAVGTTAGQFSQGASAVAVGTQAGGNAQGIGAVAVGPGAGYQHQSNSAVAIGLSAGSNTQGIYAVAIGTFAGANNQANNSIVINATGVDLDNTTANSFVVAPVRNIGSANVVQYNAATNEVSYSNTVSISGNIAGGNILTVGLVSTGGNVYAGNLIVSNGPFSGNITAQGNISAFGNILTSGVITATGNVTGGNVLTGGLVSATANITGGNITTSGQISAGGNITGPTFNGNVNFGNGTLSGNGNITGGNITACSAISTATFSSTGNATSGNVLTGGQVSASGNITSGSYVVAQNLIVGPGITGGVISALGNITGGNFITGGIISGNVVGNITGTTVSVIGNITGGNIGTLGTISANGNITGGNLSISGNITGGNLSVSGNITGANVNTNSIVGITITISGTSISLNPTGNINVNSRYLSNLPEPVQNQDAATKNYVDTIAQGLHIHQPANLATTSDLATWMGISSGNVVYAQPAGIGNGTGATLTFSGNSLTALDGVAVTNGMRLLVKNQANAVTNGVYSTSANAFVITRSVGEANGGELDGGDFLFVSTGNVNGATSWVQTTDFVVIGTSNVVFQQFSGAGTYSANTQAGLVLVGSVFNAKVDNTTTAFDGSGNIIVKAGAVLTTPNIGAATGTSVSTTGTITGSSILGSVVSASANITGGNVLTGGLVSATGNIAGNYFIGNGSALTGITVGAGSQIINGTSNVTVASGANVTVGIAGTTIATYASTGEYITGIISASGNIVSAGNVTGGNILTTGLISAAGNIAGNYFIGNGSQLTGIASGGGASDARVMGYNLVFGG